MNDVYSGVDYRTEYHLCQLSMYARYENDEDMLGVVMNEIAEYTVDVEDEKVVTHV